MARRATRTLSTALLMVLAVTSVAAQTSDPGDAGSPSVVDRIAIQTSADQRRQIVEAIAAAPLLSGRLAALASSGALTAIEIVEQPDQDDAGRSPFGAATPVRAGSPFAATLDGARMVIASSLLTKLRRARLFDVVQPDDVLPNQTVYVLAHLAAHLADPVPPLAGSTLETYMNARLTREARASIDAWNATVDEARHRHDDGALNGRQVASLLLNERYRFALLGLRPLHVAGPTLSDSGAIDPTPANVEAIVQTLKQSPIADLE